MRLPTFTHKSPRSFQNVLIWLVFLFVVGFLLVMVIASAKASEKYDGDCQPNATVGRCADKPYTPVVPQSQPEPVSQNTITVDKPVETGENWGK